jgi:hypothetical protein
MLLNLEGMDKKLSMYDKCFYDESEDIPQKVQKKKKY